MAAKVVAMNQQHVDRCELCGHRFEAGFAARMRHLRGSHPAYARGLLLRLAAPLAMIAGVLVLAVAHAPQWAYFVALGGSYALLFFGRVRSRLERTRAGATPSLSLRRILREGGLAFVLFIPVVAALVYLLGRR